MKNLIFISFILIILFKTGNVFSDNNIFNVNNIEINQETSNNNEKLVNTAFKKAFNELINRLLMEEDYKKISSINLTEIKKLISYYQILNEEKESTYNNKVRFNVFFDKDRMHSFFYNQDILYSDIVNTEVIIFPLLKKKEQYFIFTKNMILKTF